MREISADPACSRGSASEEKLPAASVRSESNVKQYRPLPGGSFRPSMPCCLTVAKALFSSLGRWAFQGLAAGKFSAFASCAFRSLAAGKGKRHLVSCPFRKERWALQADTRRPVPSLTAMLFLARSFDRSCHSAGRKPAARGCKQFGSWQCRKASKFKV